ncbi:MAG: hypothetical protein QMD86_01275 [Patescibacteria group bacterium]|nr:hypothetical protein [Patescibacteria group bacterium]
MPLKKAEDGGQECPLGKFRLKFTDSYPQICEAVDICAKGCKLFKPTTETIIDIDKMCRCPANASKQDYDKALSHILKVKNHFSNSALADSIIRCMNANGII